MLNFIDDVLIFSKILDEHVKHVIEVFKIQREKKLYVTLKKCELFKQEVQSLGHKVSADGISFEDKIKTIKPWPIPQNIKQIQSFIGTCSDYRKFIQNFAKIAELMIPFRAAGRKGHGIQLGCRINETV